MQTNMHVYTHLECNSLNIHNSKWQNKCYTENKTHFMSQTLVLEALQRVTTQPANFGTHSNAL